MMYRVISAALAASMLVSVQASAASLPAIKASSSNQVPACATPGRLMAFAQSRNSRINQRFDDTATAYMRFGEALKIRWDYAFFQMLVETANLSFVGDVKPSQYNFAGLGATGGGVRGERFDNLFDGVKAHLQHVLMYSGEHIDDPVAERTRKVQEWGVLTKWQRSIRGPMTFAHLTRQWSPKDRGYARDIGAVASAFYKNFCDKPDPHPELVAEARGRRGVKVDTAAAIKTDTDAAKGKAAAKRAIADARETSGPNRFGLGAGSSGSSLPSSTPDVGASPPAAFTVLNGNSEPPNTPAATQSTGSIETASAASAAASAAANSSNSAAASASQASKCRVWQASYGGAKAVIIKAVDKDQTNYTVLDVNEGREQREVAAYIAAYAKNGTSLGEFQTSGKALTKAFELCPES
ncbi:MAG TPA: glucosaminidase domain-containing protein [Hyphomicrobiaceae bacterium]|nr:glucosaminidase domain-containing protein [Hyphomicrobiaceae bacterium]